MNRFITAAWIVTLFASSAFAEDLHVTLTPVKSTAGQMFYALYNSEASFKASDSAYQSGTAPVQMGQTEIDLTNIVPGDYAFTAFQDLNNNGILDTDAIGRPNEPFGISNITKTLWSFPKWDVVKFEIASGQTTSISILMK
jgi:uncharacterized protein (DUF2141 family)